MDIDELQLRLKNFNISDEVKKICEKAGNVNWIEEANRNQLWDGKNAEDKDLSPKYSEDPYFKTREAGERYAKWKQVITPSPNRDPDVPNLYINGAFYRKIFARIQSKFIDVITSSNLGAAIVSKYRNILGLTIKNKELFAKERISPDLKQVMDRKIYG
jgi:hypothetical protein